MLSVRNLLIALVAVVGDGFQAMAGDCGPPNQCFQSLSKDPIGAEPYCSSILTSPKTTITTTLSGAHGVTSTILATHTVTKTVTTGTRTLDGSPALETSISSTSITEQIQSTLTSEATVTDHIVLTSPITQTSLDVDTVQTTIYVYQTSTTVILTSTTFITTQTIGDYAGTETEYLATETDLVVTLVPRGNAGASPVPTPTYLSTCSEHLIYRACWKLYPPSTSTVIETVAPSLTASDVLVTETITVTEHDGDEATVPGATITRTVVIPGTRTIYTTELATVCVTQTRLLTTVVSPTEVVVLGSTVTEAQTETTFSPTVTEYSTRVITSVHTDDLDGLIKTITLSTLTRTVVSTSHTSVPTYLSNAGFDDEPPTTGPWQEYNAGTRAPISISTFSQAGPYSLQMEFMRLTENFHYSGYIFQPLPKAVVVPEKLYTFSAYLQVAASARPRNDGCSTAYLYCAFGRDKYTQAYQYSRYDDTSVMVGQWFKAERTCRFTAAQINNPYDVGVVIGFTCGNTLAYIDSVAFEDA